MEYKHLGTVIKVYREDFKFTQEKLAEIAGVTPRTIQRVEAHDECQDHTLGQIAKAFEVGKEELLTYCDFLTKLEEKALEYEAMPPEERPNPVFLKRIVEGAVVLQMATSTLASLHHNDNPTTTEEAEVIGGFLQDLADYREVWGNIPLNERMIIGVEFTERIQKLDDLGFMVYATVINQRVDFHGQDDSLETAVIFVLQKTNPLVSDTPDEIPTLLPAKTKVSL